MYSCKGVLFDFTNNKKIKDTGFAIEGKDVAGYVQGNNIAINIDSSKALNTVVGHEITHILEGTELYPALQDAVKIFAESKGEYNSKLQSITKIYEGIEDANIENELTAELVGEYLFSDTDFIKNLSVEQPGLFKKIYDEVKYLCRVVTTRSKEAKELEKVKKTFAEVYRQKNNTVTDNGVKYSLKNDSSGKKYWHIDTQKDIFKGLETTKDLEKAAFNYIIGMRDGQVVVDAIDGKKMQFIRISAEEFTNSEESKNLKADNPMMFAQKMRLIPSLEDLASNANVNWWSPDQKNHKLFKERGFENFRGRVGIDNVIFNYVIRSGKAKFGDVFYDINLEVDQILPHTKDADASEIKKSTSIDYSLSQDKTTVNNDSMQNDVKYSLVDGSTDIAPEMNNNIYGEDIKLEIDDVPIKETPSAETTDNNTIEVPDITVDDMEFTVLGDDANVPTETNYNSNEKSNDFFDEKAVTRLSSKVIIIDYSSQFQPQSFKLFK